MYIKTETHGDDDDDGTDDRTGRRPERLHTFWARVIQTSTRLSLLFSLSVVCVGLPESSSKPDRCEPIDAAVSHIFGPSRSR